MTGRESKTQAGDPGAEARRHRAVFDSIDQGACIIERLAVGANGRRNYRYVAMNPAMRVMFGIPDLTGETIRDHFPNESEDWYDDYDRVLVTGEQIRFERESAPQGMVLEMSISRLQDAPNQLLVLMQDVTQRYRAEAALNRSEARSRALLNASSDVIYRMSSDWQEMRQLHGRGFLSDMEGPSIHWIDEYIFAEDQPKILAAIQRAVEQRGVFELEHRVRRADGSEGWTASRAVPVFDKDGVIVEWFGMASDITDRVVANRTIRDAEEHQKMLAGELNHRLKNMLALVQSIAVQTLRNADSLKDASTKITSRIVALASAADGLTSTSWKASTLAEVVRAGLTSVQEFSERISVAGPVVTVGPQVALAVTLAVNELATNATKYGALSNETGSIALQWSVADNHGKPQFSLNWQETDGPEVRRPERRGFGTQLIDRALRSHFSGKLEILYAATGLKFSIDTPLADLLK